MTTVPCAVPHLRCRIPARPNATITRGRLVDALNKPPGTVTLVTAPAGSGKTTLLVDWATSLAETRNCSVAWLTVDESDNSLPTLRACVASSLVQSGSTALADAVSQLPHPGEPEYERYSTLMFDALESVSEPIWLVFDDAHLLHDHQSLVALGNFLHWPPSNVHVVIAGRFEPPLALQKLRLDGRVNDIATADIAFTGDEAEQMFRESGITLSSNAFDALISRTQGWAAGLRLATMTLTDCPDADSMIGRFTGSQRAVADYLVSEVLAGLPPDVKRFLIETSVPAWFTVDLAEQLTGSAQVQDTLDLLFGRNFLIEQTPGPVPTFRYHPLMRGYLRAEMLRLGVAQARNLETVASQWFTEFRQPLHALEHSVHAGDTRAITATLSTSGLSLIMEGHARQLLDALDHSPTAVRDAQFSRLLCAAAHLATGGTAPAVSILASISRRTGSQPTDSTARRDLVAEMLRRSLGVQAAVRTGGIDAALRQLEQLDVGHSGNPALDAFALTAAGTAYLYVGKLDAARAALPDAIAHARAGGLHLAAVTAMTTLSASWLLAGRLDRALRESHSAVDHAREHDLASTDMARVARSLCALVAHLRMDTVAHPPDMWTSIGEAPDSPVADYGRRTAAVLEDRTDTRGATRVGREWLEFDRPVVPGFEALLAPVVMQQYNAAGEILWATELIGVTARRLGRTGEVSLLTAEVHRRTGRLDAADAELALVIGGSRPCVSPVTLVRALVAAAAIAQARRNPTKAYELTTRALGLAATEHVLRPFAEAGPDMREVLTRNHGRFGHLESFADAARGAIPRSEPMGHGGSLVALTPRELELLRELPSWRTAEQIASDHFVSVNTIKTHLRGIYRKLEVRSRRDAIAAAHDLGLL